MSSSGRSMWLAMDISSECPPTFPSHPSPPTLLLPLLFPFPSPNPLSLSPPLPLPLLSSPPHYHCLCVENSICVSMLKYLLYKMEKCSNEQKESLNTPHHQKERDKCQYKQSWLIRAWGRRKFLVIITHTPSIQKAVADPLRCDRLDKCLEQFDRTPPLLSHYIAHTHRYDEFALMARTYLFENDTADEPFSPRDRDIDAEISDLWFDEHVL